MLADEQTSPEQFAILRKMTGQKRLELAEQMFWLARDLKKAGVRHQHPDWPEEKVIAEVNRIFSGSGAPGNLINQDGLVNPELSGHGRPPRTDQGPD